MTVPFEYIPGFIENPDAVFKVLWTEIDWRRIGQTPRREYYCNDFPKAYTYGKGAGVRTYETQPYHPVMLEMRRKLETLTKTTFEALFLNGYENSRDSLFWHADDSPEMDDARPIAIISLGAEREIWFAPNDDMKDVTKLRLGNGSLCLMAPGMQETHKHRIPKAGYECGPRISLTFRGYVEVEPAVAG